MKPILYQLRLPGMVVNNQHTFLPANTYDRKDSYSHTQYLITATLVDACKIISDMNVYIYPHTHTLQSNTFSINFVMHSYFEPFCENNHMKELLPFVLLYQVGICCTSFGLLKVIVKITRSIHMFLSPSLVEHKKYYKKVLIHPKLCLCCNPVRIRGVRGGEDHR